VVKSKVYKQIKNEYIMIQRIYKPKTDNKFFEQLSEIVFIIGFNYKVVQRKWPGIKKAFRGFSIEKVSGLSEKDVDKMVKNEDIIRNRRKIMAIIKNAKLCMEIKKEHGSVLKWIEKAKKENKKDPLFSETLKDQLMQFHGIGETTSEWLKSLHEAKKDYVEYETEK